MTTEQYESGGHIMMRLRRVERGSLVADAGTLAAGTAVAVVLAYALLLLITRGLGETEAAPVVLIWNFWLLATSALGGPVQQWIVRNSVVGVPTSRERDVLIRLTGLVVAITAVVTLGARAADEILFRSSSWAFPISLGLVTLGSWGLGVYRGQLAAAGRYGAVATTLPGENLIRLVFAAALLAADADAAAVALVIPAGYLILLSAPVLLSPQDRRTSGGTEDGAFASLTLISVVSQFLFASVPFIVSATGGSAAAVTGAFAIVAAVRVPNLFATAMSLRILETFARIAVDRPWEAPIIRRRIALAVLGGAVASAAFMASIGRMLVAAVFGIEELLAPLPTAMVTTAAVLAVGALLLSLSAVAGGTPRPVVGFGLSSLAVAFTLAAAPFEPETRASLSFLLAECVFFGGLALTPTLNRPGQQLREPPLESEQES